MTAATQSGVSRRKRARLSGRARREARSFYFFVSPWLIGFFVFTLFPMVISLLSSFTNFDGYLNTLKWVGLRNFAQAFHDADALWGLQRTVLYALVSVPLGLVFAYVFALILNQNIRGRGAFGALFYIPTVVPAVATATIWKLILTKNAGLLNAALSLVRPGTAVPWLQQYAFWALIMMGLWGIGGGVIIFLAALQGVPQELEEAALIDGASRLQMFRAITIPLVTPVIFLQLVMGIIGALQVLQTPLLLAETVSGYGGLATLPPRANYMYSIHAMQQIMVNSRYGYAMALLWLFFGFILVVTLLVFRTQRYWVYYEVEQEGGAGS